ncbi:MAG: lipopolysaccharide biosynthesis protein [Ruminococcaceae bacterium]|nr:lipopolysaccharide biosynthesis protein [Oscillospiraceae bacterium]
MNLPAWWSWKGRGSMARNEVKWGAILSYVLIIANSLYGLVIMPFVLGTIGESEYGVYKTIGSLTATVAVMELGLGSTMQRFLAKYRAEKDETKCQNFSAMCIIQALILCVGVFLVGVALFFTLEPTYGKTFTAAEMTRAKQIFVLLIFHVVLHFFENVFFGIIAGYNKFIFSNTAKLCALVGKILLLLTVLPLARNAVTIVAISLGIEVVTLTAEYLFVTRAIHHKIKLHFWDKAVFKESFVYTIMLFVQSLIIQFNGNVDNIVIGAVIGTAAVTVYSFALQIFNMYEQCATAISGVVLPSITNQIHQGATPRDLENTVIKFGRAQWAVLGAALGGFVCLGQEFFGLWLGAGFEDCYYLALILMIPVTVPLIVNVCLAILKARNLMKFRTISLAYAAGLNVILTVVGTHFFGYWAAAVGTAASTVVGGILSMNIYYHVKLKMNMFRIYGRILHRITPCIVVACAVTVALNYLTDGSGWMPFILKAGAFICVYGVAMLLFGLTSAEKSGILRKRVKK